MTQNQANIEKLVSGYKVPATRSKERAFELLSERIAHPEATRLDKNGSLVYSLYGGAAAAILFLFLLLSALHPKSKLENKQMAILEQILPDQTNVVLKAKSKLSYSKRFIDGARLVNLKGEAFFDVSKGKKFLVDFPGGELKVLGTKFNIRAYNKNEGRIDCYEGAVWLHVQEQEFVLKKGQALIFTGTHTEGPLNIDIESVSDIRTNVYHWTNRSMGEILNLICSRSGYKLETNEAVLKLRFTGTVNLSNETVALTILTKAMNLSFELDHNKLLVRENN